MKLRDPVVTAYALCNCLGRTTEEAIAALAAGHSGLASPPMPLPFETVCGAAPGGLPSLPDAWSAYDTRQARIALLTLDQIRGPVAAAVGRWGPARVALVMATSTGGIAVSEDAYDAVRDTGRRPASYDLERQHNFFAFVELLRAETGIAGPATVVSTACSSSDMPSGTLSGVCSYIGFEPRAPTSTRNASTHRNSLAAFFSPMGISFPI